MTQRFTLKERSVLQEQVDGFKEATELSQEEQMLIDKHIQNITVVTDLDNLSKDLPKELLEFIEKRRERYIESLISRRINKKKLEKLLRDRDEVETREILEDILKNTESKHLKEVIDIFFSNQRLLTESTILRGKTTDGTGVGQTTLEGSTSCVNPQVFILKYNGGEFISPFRWRSQLFEEYDREVFNTTVLHELVHSFTRYITATFEGGKQKEVLTQEEINFYNIAKQLHEEYLQKSTTGDKYLDNLDEFIAKSITSDTEWDGSPFRESMTKAFGEMYKKNTRKIVSLSRHLLHNK